MALLGSSAAVAGVMTICPALATFSAMIVAVAAGPAINSSRWESPTMKKSNVPVWTPTDIRSRTWPAVVLNTPISRRA